MRETTRITTLDNGIRIATETMPHHRSVSMGVWVGAGTRAEPKAINGAAHFLEHMAFKGTKTRSARQIAEEIEAVGGYMNAYTSREVTAYYARSLADDLPLATEIIADILQNPVFDETEFERERGVILQEIGQCYDTPDDLIYDRFQETAFPDQAMGRPVLGTPETVKGLQTNSVSDFMARRYAGQNMVLCAAGPIDHDEMVDLASRHFTSSGDSPETELEAARYTGGANYENRDSEQVHLLLGFEGPSLQGKDLYTGGLLSSLLGGGMSSRLFQSVREERGLVYSVYSFAWSFQDSGLFGVYAGTGEAETKELLPVIADEILGVTQDITEEELNRAKAQMRASLLMSREGTSGRCDALGNQILGQGRVLSEEEQLSTLLAVETNDVIALAKRIFATPPTIAAIGPLTHLEAPEKITDRFQASVG